jgi:phosphoglycerol transferase MdoB-like AlkP superfamily enzyme
MHDYTEAYYYRSTIHTNIGAMEFYGVQKLGIAYDTAYENWASDEDFMNAAMDIQLNDLGEEPFMLWLTTVSPHQPYVVSSIEGDKYYDLTEGTDYPTDLRRYMSKLKTLDNALGILLDRLEEAGILDDTVIVLFGDHYPYGLKKDTISKVLTYDLDDYEIERTPMVIYNTQIEHVEVDKYSSYINLTPTLANMFNLDYDPRLYLGKDVMSDDYVNMVAFADGSWKNDKVYYNASKSTIKYYTLEEVDTETIKNITSIVSNRMQISKEIIRNNYFEYLDEALEELRQNKQDILNDKLEN